MINNNPLNSKHGLASRPARTLRPGCGGLLIAGFLLTSHLTAQLDRSSLNGTVTDPDGSRIPGAAVRATHSGTGFERLTLTSSQGSYSFDSLPIGSYTVIFTCRGFSEVRLDAVDQHVGQTRTVDVQLRVSARTTDRTTVTEPLIHLDTSGASVGGPIEQAQLRQLPLNGRNWASLAALAPGAIDNGPGDQRSIRFAGHGLDDNSFLFDGVDASPRP